MKQSVPDPKLSRRRKLRGISINVLVPNMITVMSLCAGMTGIRFALDGNWHFAVGAIAIASVLDTLDGRMARLLKGASRFGAELDSFGTLSPFPWPFRQTSGRRFPVITTCQVATSSITTSCAFSERIVTVPRTGTAE